MKIFKSVGEFVHTGCPSNLFWIGNKNQRLLYRCCICFEILGYNVFQNLANWDLVLPRCLRDPHWGFTALSIKQQCHCYCHYWSRRIHEDSHLWVFCGDVIVIAIIFEQIFEDLKIWKFEDSHLWVLSGDAKLQFPGELSCKPHHEISKWLLPSCSFIQQLLLLLFLLF